MKRKTLILLTSATVLLSHAAFAMDTEVDENQKKLNSVTKVEPTSNYDKIMKARAISLDVSLRSQDSGIVFASIENIENSLTISHSANNNNNATQIAWIPFYELSASSINLKEVNQSSIFLTDTLTGCTFLVLGDYVFHIDAWLSAKDAEGIVKATIGDLASANGYLLLNASAINKEGNNGEGVFYYGDKGVVGQETIVVGHAENGKWNFKYKTYNTAWNENTVTKTSASNWINLGVTKATGEVLINKLYDFERWKEERWQESLRADRLLHSLSH